MTTKAEYSFDVLPDGSLVLTLDGACIQSTAKRAHRELTAALLEGRADGDVEGAAVDLLERFLSMNDFAAMRTEHPELTGHERCRVRCQKHDDGAVQWEIVQ